MVIIIIVILAVWQIYALVGVEPMVFEFESDAGGWAVKNAHAEYRDGVMVLNRTGNGPITLEKRFPEPINPSGYSMLEIRMTAPGQQLNYEGVVAWQSRKPENDSDRPLSGVRTFRIPPGDPFKRRLIHLGASWNWSQPIHRLTITPINASVKQVQIDVIRLYRASPWSVLRAAVQDFRAQNKTLQHNLIFLLLLLLPAVALVCWVWKIMTRRFWKESAYRLTFDRVAFRIVIGCWLFVIGSALFSERGIYNSVREKVRLLGGIDSEALRVITSEYGSGQSAQFLSSLLPREASVEIRSDLGASYWVYRLNYLLYPRRVWTQEVAHPAPDPPAALLYVIDREFPVNQIALQERVATDATFELTPGGEPLIEMIELAYSDEEFRLGRVIVDAVIRGEQTADGLEQIEATLEGASGLATKPATVRGIALPLSATWARVTFDFSGYRLRMRPGSRHRLSLSLKEDAKSGATVRMASNSRLAIRISGQPSGYELAVVDPTSPGKALWISKQRLGEKLSEVGIGKGSPAQMLQQVREKIPPHSSWRNLLEQWAIRKAAE